MLKITFKVLVLLYLMTDSLALSCPTGTYPSGTRCASCGEGCNSCTDNFHCTKCSAGFSIAENYSDWVICKKRKDPQELNALPYIALAAILTILLFAILVLARHLCKSQKGSKVAGNSRLDSSYFSIKDSTDGSNSEDRFKQAAGSLSEPGLSNRTSHTSQSTEVRTSTAFAPLFPPADTPEHEAAKREP